MLDLVQRVLVRVEDVGGALHEREPSQQRRRHAEFDICVDGEGVVEVDEEADLVRGGEGRGVVAEAEVADAVEEDLAVLALLPYVLQLLLAADQAARHRHRLELPDQQPKAHLNCVASAAGIVARRWQCREELAGRATVRRAAAVQAHHARRAIVRGRQPIFQRERRRGSGGQRVEGGAAAAAAALRRPLPALDVARARCDKATDRPAVW